MQKEKKKGILICLFGFNIVVSFGIRLVTSLLAIFDAVSLSILALYFWWLKTKINRDQNFCFVWLRDWNY